MKRCGKYEELVARFLHGELLIQEKEELEGHLSVCPDCERLYRESVEIDRVLREIPDRLVDPPAYLRGRILANLPEAAPGKGLSWGWGRWAAALGGAAACAIAAGILYTSGILGTEKTRVASSPAPPAIQQETAVPQQAPSAPPAESTVATATAPAPEEAPARQVRVATAPTEKVQVIREVKIYFYYPPAKKVAVTGDFNGWARDGQPLAPAGKPGLWTANLRLKPGAYSYNFIVDGEVLVPDPNSANQSPDGYGGMNSIMLVKEGNHS